MKRRRLIGLLTLFAILPMIVGTVSADQRALDMVPANAHVAVVVPNPGALSKSINELTGSLGLTEMLPGLFAMMGQPGMGAEFELDVWGMAKGMMGIGQGIDDNGPIILVLDLTQDDQGQILDEPKITIITAVTNYEDFLANFGGDEKKEIADVRLTDGSTAYIRHVNNFAVMAETQKDAEAYTPGKNAKGLLRKAGEYGRKAIQSGELVYYVDLEAMRKGLGEDMKWLDAKQTRATEEAREQGGDEAAKATETVTSSLRKMLGDAQAMVASYDISSDGFGTSTTIQFKPGSESAKQFAGTQTKGSLLSKLPDDQYVFALAADADALHIKDWIGPIMKLMETSSDAGMGMVKQLPAVMDLIASSNRVAYAFYTPQPQSVMNSFDWKIIATTESDDAAKLMQSYEKLITEMNGMKVTTAEGEVQYETNFMRDAVEISEEKVSQYEVKFQIPMQMLQQMGGAGAMASMFTTQMGYIAQVDNYVVTSSGTNPLHMTAAIEALKQDGGLNSQAALKAARTNNQPDYLVAEGYFNMSGLLSAVAPLFIANFMPNQEYEVPQDLPPLSMGMGMHNGGAAMQMYLPARSIKEVMHVVQLVQSAMQPPQMQQQPQQQQQNGGPRRAPR